uniref:Kinase suppressor of ras 1 n=1 Tax=Latimeria chalumnae TaxID=7897 RepID=H3BDR1_LATCH
VSQEVPEDLTLDTLLDLTEADVNTTMKRYGVNIEECSRLNAALTCLKNVNETGTFYCNITKKVEFFANCSPASPTWPSKALFPPPQTGQSPSSVGHVTLPTGLGISSKHSRSVLSREKKASQFSFTIPVNKITFTVPNYYTGSLTVHLSKARILVVSVRSAFPTLRGIFFFLRNLVFMRNSRSIVNLLRMGALCPISFFLEDTLNVPRGSPQMVRRDIGLSVTHRFATRSWLSQTCQVCHKNMMLGVKCKHCRLKCHNKCTKEAPACRISFLPIPNIRRTESVPSDINNQVDRPVELQFGGTLPKALTKKEHPPVITPLDSSSNPSSTTSSTPSSPAPFQSSNPPSATPPPNPSPLSHRDNRFHFPVEVANYPQQITLPPEIAECNSAVKQIENDGIEEQDAETEEQEGDNKSESEYDADEVDELPVTRFPGKGPISRKASQTSVYLQEWDIPFEQVELGELIGKGRWGKVYKGKWHGEVAIRMLEIDGNNQDHLKLFKKEVMNYRQTRHENVVLFMGACMNPPHLAIITSFCKGRTLYSFVRDPKISLDINKTRQIAQEIIKGIGYLHARGIVHKDLKSKNVFYDNGKVVITDFGLFGISGVVQEGRREYELQLSHGWLCYLAPEIVREMTPGKNEDKLPFTKAADVYAFGTIWYELQARDWPFTNQPPEATIWQVGSGEGVKQVLATATLGKEVTEILSACWSYDPRERPTFTQLMDMLEKLPKLNRRLSHPGHFWKSADVNSSKIAPRFERLGLGILEQNNQKI